MPSNLNVLTSSHGIIAAKKRAKREQIKEIVFDEGARKEFLTGFHKRKLQKKELAKKKALEREKQERLEARREKRQMLAEQAAQNAREVEKAYGGIVNGEDLSDEDSDSIPSRDKGKQKAAEVEDEYEDEEQVATVTVVEDFDPHELLHGAARTEPQEDTSDPEYSNPPVTSHPPSLQKLKPEAQSLGAKKTQAKTVKKAKEIKYQTKAARKAERTKQQKRKSEKAERAGGKASRKKVHGRGKR
ncbi:hypothetical protein K474DRAFT_1704027 [Panus rudis PR-1116 ss-1]|nr:hypothetical protein K474DRAFT_1704027 [Panus rudis PR-1116 ss-1]